MAINPIDSFKQKIGFGVRTNLFSVQITLPDAVRSAANFTSETGDGVLNIICISANLPKPRPLTSTNIKYAGESMTIATGYGDYEKLKLGFMETENLLVTKVVTAWIQYIQAHNRGTYSGTLASPSTYKSDSVVVSSLDKDRTPLYTATYKGVYPLDLGAGISHSYDTQELVKKEIEFEIDWFDFTDPKATA